MEVSRNTRFTAGHFALFAGTLLVLAAAIYRWWLVAALDAAWLPVPGIRRRVTIWASAGIIATLYAFITRESARRGAGLWLMIVPLVSPIWSFISSIPDLTDSGSVRSALTREELSDQYIFGLMYDIGYVGTGFLLWIGRIPESFSAIAGAMTRAGVPARPEGRSALAGYILFPGILFGAAFFSWLFSRSSGLSNGDEASIWDNMTPFHNIMISITAAVTEEMVYRVVGIALFTAFFARLGATKNVALGAAVLLQAIIFGAAHGGYGTWSHVLLPLMFGLAIAGIYLYWGIWAAIVIHFLIDVYAFAYPLELTYPGFYSFLSYAILLNLFATLGYLVFLLWRIGTNRRDPSAWPLR